MNYLAVPLAWLVPGLGHLLLGQRRRGILFVVTIHVLFASGMLLGGIRAINPPEQAIWTYTQYMAGWPMLVSSRIQAGMAPQIDKLLNTYPNEPSFYDNEYYKEFGTSRSKDLADPSKEQQRKDFANRFFAKYPNATNHPKVQDIGAVYCGIAGMLNLLVVFDVLLRVTGAARANSKKAASGAAQEGTGAA